MGLFIKLLMGHALADFSLQTDVMARHKNRHYQRAQSDVAPGQKLMPTWWYWLTAHALIHGAAVLVVTGSMALALAEIACHWLIDFGKCEGLYGKHLDQFAHMLCKVVWVCIVMGAR